MELVVALELVLEPVSELVVALALAVTWAAEVVALSEWAWG